MQATFTGRENQRQQEAGLTHLRSLQWEMRSSEGIINEERFRREVAVRVSFVEVRQELVGERDGGEESIGLGRKVGRAARNRSVVPAPRRGRHTYRRICRP